MGQIYFSFFKAPVMNTIPQGQKSIVDVYNKITSGDYRWATEELRKLNDKERAAYKSRNLDYVTFSGLFKKRCDDGLLEYTGLICMDFDHVTNFDKLWNNLKNDRGNNLRLMFRSPSGDGIKAIYYIGKEKEKQHAEVYERMTDYFLFMYGELADIQCKDISRPCFLCYDPDAYLNTMPIVEVNENH